MPPSRRRVRAGPASFAERPPPAAGFTIAKKRSMECGKLPSIYNFPKNLPPKCQPSEVAATTSQRLHGGSTIELCQTLRQSVPFYLKRSRAGKVFFVQHDSMNALVVQQAAVQERDALAQILGEGLAGIEMYHED